MKALDAGTRITLNNILFTTDFSSAAEAALPYALGIAGRYGAKVYGVHVRALEMYAAAPAGTWATINEASRVQAQADADRLHSRLRSVPHEVVIGEGDTWEVVSSLLDEKQIDLIVLGTRGRTGLGKVVLGSVAEKIFRQAKCPVLTVGPHVSPDLNRQLQIREVLYATDFSAESLAAAPFAISLAQENQARLTLLHVIPRPATEELVHPENYVDSTLRLLKNLLPPDAELWCEPKFAVECGDPADKILEVAAAHHADLIVLGVRHAAGPVGVATHLSRPIAHKVVAKAACPVLTVRG
jgi:nucleotide-binding universal stress UspA family protein